MRTSARTVSGGSVLQVLHVQPLHQLLVDAHLELLELSSPRSAAMQATGCGESC